MDEIALIGRILFSLMFIASGINHITQRSSLAQYAQSMNVPMATSAVPLSGVLIVVGALMVVLGIWGDLGAVLIIAFLLPTTFFFHGFWKFDDAQTRQEQQIQFMKNLTITGGALVLLALFLGGKDNLAYTLTGPLFG